MDAGLIGGVIASGISATALLITARGNRQGQKATALLAERKEAREAQEAKDAAAVAAQAARDAALRQEYADLHTEVAALRAELKATNRVRVEAEERADAAVKRAREAEDASYRCQQHTLALETRIVELERQVCPHDGE